VRRPGDKERRQHGASDDVSDKTECREPVAAAHNEDTTAVDDLTRAYQRLRREVDGLRRRATAAERARARAEAERAAISGELERLRFQFRSIINSTSWQILHPFRAVGRRLPRFVRRAVRFMLRLVWWALTWQMPKKLKTLGEPSEEEFEKQGSAHDGYSDWIEQYDTITDRDRRAIKSMIEAMPDAPTISVVMPVYEADERYLRAAIESVRAQLYPHWELCIADDASPSPHIRTVLEEHQAGDPRIKVHYRSENGHISAATNSALALATGDFVAFLDNDDVLPEQALYVVAASIVEQHDVDLLFSDEDKIDAEGRRFDPYFKSDWNPELMLGQNMFAHLGVFRRRLVDEIGGCRLGYEGSQDYDLMLRASARTTPDRIKHLPHILYHWRALPGSVAADIGNKAYALENARKAIGDFLSSQGAGATVGPSTHPFYHRVCYKVSEQPLVSLIIPTRDRVDLLRVCIDGLINRTNYSNLEIIIVDNDSRHRATLRYFDELREDPRVRVLRIEGDFNFSALNNRAAEIANGEFLGLINNDIEVIEPDWLQEMIGLGLQPGVGAVGAKLYYPNDTVQHAGVVLGIGGVAGHEHRNAPRDAEGHFGRLLVARDVSCITAACMIVSKRVFDDVGGFDEIGLKIAFNDVDFCLKIRRAGYRIVWTPYAELYHHESASRGTDIAIDKARRFSREVLEMQRRWGAALEEDPFYNPNLTLAREDFHLAFPPRIAKPW
jgi:O-antigen biosynthesis protein